MEVDGLQVNVEPVLVDDDVVPEDEVEAKLHVVMLQLVVELLVVALLLVVGEVVELEDVLLDVVEGNRCCGGGAGRGCGREGCRCRAGFRR